MAGRTLRFVLETGAASRAVVVTVASDDVTLGEVLVAAGCPVPPSVEVDGRHVPTDRSVTAAAIVNGGTVALPGAGRRGRVPTRSDAAAEGPRLAIVAGPGTGASVSLADPVVAGRDPDSDLVVPSPTVSRRHCRLVRDGEQLTVTDLATTNGTWADGRAVGPQGTTVEVGAVLRIGAVVLRVEPSPADDRPRGWDHAPKGSGNGGVPFNRPPRPAPPPPVAAVAVPRPAARPAPVPPLPVAAVAVPVLLGAGMVIVVGSWRYAAFLALSPVLLLAGALAARVRARRAARASDAEDRAAVAVFASALASAAAATRARSWALLPPIGEVLRRAAQPSTRLWERRSDHDDALRLLVGVGPVPWLPPLDLEHGQRPSGAARAVVERWTTLPGSPVAVDLAAGGVVGVVGDRDLAVAVARSLLLQACVHHGPADVAVAVAGADDGTWGWTTWLPHTAARSGRRRLAAGTADGRTLLRSLRDRGEDTTLLVVLDDVELLRGRDTPVRQVLRGEGGPVAGIVVAATVDQLPAACSTVVEVGPEGEARVTRPRAGEVVAGVIVAGVDAAACERAARRLAGLEDPEVAAAVGQLPRRADLLDLLPEGLDVGAAWDGSRHRAGLDVPIGVGPDGPVTLDLVAAGPHVLVGGTTGAGKSELLRTVVAGLAATRDPDHCTFVLVDYKGGAAFDACADLPHVVGVVTDLDEHLGERALRCLEAELVHREQRLRAAGVSDLPAWRRLPAAARGEPLPRLLVVIDEFATLRAELPDFVAALVGIAQRGRSLGVHLVLGTQRPAGAVDDNVRANVNVRIALRMTDDRDSVDVVGTPDAAAIPPAVPGRGLLRTGPRPPVPLQAALVTGVSEAASRRVRVAPLRFGSDPDPLPAATTAGPSDLDRLVRACADAVRERGVAVPRTPWPPPLPPSLDLDAVVEAQDVAVPYGLVDDPDRQRQVPVGWSPARGNLLVLGTAGSGTTTTLATVAIAAARRHDADALHLHVLDLGRGALEPLAALPHCGGVVTARETERRTRLRALLLAEAERRRGLPAHELQAVPLHVLVVDGLDTWLAALDDPATYSAFEDLLQLLAEAPRLRMAVVASVTRPGALRGAVVAATEQRLVHRLADPGDHALLGTWTGRAPELPPGRAVLRDGRVVQVARVGDLAAAVAGVAAATRAPRRRAAEVGALPPVLAWPQHPAGLVAGPGPWHVPVGLDAVSLRPIAWALHPGDHAVVLGPPASGRSGLLGALAGLAGRVAAVDVVSPAPDEWGEEVAVHGPDELPGVLAVAAERRAPTLVLVDDADLVDDPGAALVALRAARAPVRVVVAARQDAIAGDYGHWVRALARSGVGVFLRPTGDVPGELLGVRVPRRPPVASGTGRGWCVSGGEARFAQVLGSPA